MTKLNQVLAVEKGIKANVQRTWTDTHHLFQKPSLLSGIQRSYSPLNEDGELYPDESTKVQVVAETLLRSTAEALVELFDITVTKDQTNCTAKADVVVDEKVLLRQIPVTTLLFLEKQLVDMHTFVKKLPVLDPSEEWHFDSVSGVQTTKSSFTNKTKKVPRNHVKAEATDKHPAQVETYYEDIVVGKWKTVKFSGALPQQRVTELLNRVEKLQKAVKFAREEANAVEVTKSTIGKEVFDYLFTQVS